MKKIKKTLALLCCAVLLVCVSVGATIAYLTSTDKVENTFSVGKVVITLDEAPVDENGDAIIGEDRVKANAYHLLPGHEYDKDPTIHVGADSEDCFLFVTVVNEIAPIEAEPTIATQMATKGWVPVADVENTFVYVGTAEGATDPLAVSKNANVVVFDNFVIVDDAANETLEVYADATVTVNAFAVQEDGFEGKTAAEIWNTAFPASSETPADPAAE